MTLAQWYMHKAETEAGLADYIRSEGAKGMYSKRIIRKLQDRCATYVTLANEALARYGA